MSGWWGGHLERTVVKVNIQVSNSFDEFLFEVWALVVERLVDAQVVFQPPALVVRAGDRDDLRTH